MSNRVGTAARRWLGRAALLCSGLLGAGCSGLWDGFLAQRSCDAQTGCPPGQACNLSSQRCEPVGADGGTGQSEVSGVCVLANLCWENPRPQGNDLMAVSARAATDVWAVGMARTVLHFDGTTWQQAIEPALLDRDHLFGVHALSDRDIWLVGQGGMIHRSGIAMLSRTSWVSQSVMGGNDLLAVYSTASNAAFAVGGQRDLYGCIGCVAWSSLNPRTPGNLFGVWAASSSSIWAVGDQGIILRSNGTAGPTQESNSGTMESLTSVWGTSGTDLMAVGARGTTLRRGTGSSWTPVDAGTTDDLRGLWGAENQRWTTALRADGRGQILQLQSDQWKAVSEPGAPLNALSGYETMAQPGIWAVGANGTLLQGNGTTWTLKSQGSTEDLYAIWGVHDSNVWAGGKRGTLLHYDGLRWSQVSSPTTGDIVSIHGISAEDIWLSTSNGGLFHFNGTTWTSTSSQATSIQAVWVAASNDVWAAAEIGAMHTILHNSGQGWTIADMPTQKINAFWGSSAADIWAFGMVGAVRRWNGTSWAVGSVPAITDFLAATGVSASRMWVTSSAGSIYEWNGTVWRPTAIMGPPTLQGIAAVSDSRIMAVGNTSNARLGFIAQYSGAAWETLPTVAQRSLNAAWANPKGTIWIAGQGGAILRSRL